MSLRPHGRPPFRADHVGSLLRPPALRQAFRRRAGNEIDFSDLELLEALDIGVDRDGLGHGAGPAARQRR